MHGEGMARQPVTLLLMTWRALQWAAVAALAWMWLTGAPGWPRRARPWRAAKRAVFGPGRKTP